jgi:regulator of replication initiation timing
MPKSGKSSLARNNIHLNGQNRWKKSEISTSESYSPAPALVSNSPAAATPPTPNSDGITVIDSINIHILGQKRKSPADTAITNYSCPASSSKSPARNCKRARKDSRNEAERERRLLGQIDEHSDALLGAQTASVWQQNTISELEETILDLQEQLASRDLELDSIRRDLTSKAEENVNLIFGLRALQQTLQHRDERIHNLSNQVAKLAARERNAYRKSLGRQLALHEDGVIPIAVRIAIMRLVGLGIAFTKIKTVILICGSLMEVEVSRNLGEDVSASY